MNDNKTKYSAAIYMRLSKDDESKGESSSISTQRKMIRAFANVHCFDIYDEYVDDGISGTTFNRPAFQRMIKDIENKKINMVITKDLSRLGRDYILSGKLTEIYFPSKKVRYIAINDGYDSDSDYTEIAPFKNIVNEMYARDTSKKIRSAFIAKMNEGEFIGAFAPYGYKRDEKDKHHLVIDEHSAKIVKQIFLKSSKGELPSKIANDLNNKGILTPSMYRNKSAENMFVNNTKWSSSTVIKIINNEVYLGNMVQGKTSKISFKSKVVVNNPREDWIVVENTHEPIVNKNVFCLAKKRSKLRTCKKSVGFENIFSGIAICKDCNKNMSSVGSRKKDSSANLVCGRYKLYGKEECTNHFIDYNHLYYIVQSVISEILKDINKEYVMKKVLKEVKCKSIKLNNQDEIIKIKNRIIEIDNIILKMYEDEQNKKLSHDRLINMLEKYEQESVMINNKLEQLQNEKEYDGNKEIEVENLLNEIISVNFLDKDMLFKMIDKIEIGQGYYKRFDGKNIKNQDIRIYFKFKGKNKKLNYFL